MANILRKQFSELSQALQGLHRELLMLEAKLLEAQLGRKISPYELLDASLNNPTLAWLRHMSAMIVNIDTVVDESENLSAAEAHQIASAVSELIENQGANAATSAFWDKYSSYLSSNPDIIMRHSQVKLLLAGLRPST